MPHEIINHDDGTQTYRGIQFELYEGRCIVVSLSNLLDLGLCTPKTLQRGHKGYKSLTTLMKRIDKGLGN